MAAKPSSLPKIPCDIPLWALARDARYVLIVEVLSAGTVTEQNVNTQIANVRVVASLKEPSPWLLGTVIKTYPFPESAFYQPPQKPNIWFRENASLCFLLEMIEETGAYRRPRRSGLIDAGYRKTAPLPGEKWKSVLPRTTRYDMNERR